MRGDGVGIVIHARDDLRAPAAVETRTLHARRGAARAAEEIDVE